MLYEVITEHTVDQHGKVQVVSTGHAGGTGQAHAVIGSHHIPDLNIDLAEMGVETENPLAVIDHNHIAVNSEVSYNFV